jgi:type I restriction enzyme, S subunit
VSSPVGWKHVVLGDVVSFPGGRARVPDGAGVRPTLTFKGLRATGVLDLDDPVPAEDAESKNMTALQPGDVVATAQGHATGWILKKVGHISADTPFAYAASTLQVMRPRPDRLDDRFLLHYLSWPLTYRRVTDMAGPRRSYTAKMFGSIPIPLPPIEEQRRIAAALDATDELRAKRREALAKLDTLTQAIFIDMFVRDAAAFEVSPIGELVASGKNTIRTGPFGSQLLHEEFTEEGIAVLGIDNAVNNRFVWSQRRFISPEKYEQLKRFTVRPGDVLVTIMGTTGRVAIVPDDIPMAINTKHLCCITLDQAKCLPWYLWAALRFHPSVRRQLGATHGAVMPGLNMGKIKQAELPVPPLHLQEQFVQRLNAVERQSSVSAASQDELSLLFASLQQRAFRGEL